LRERRKGAVANFFHRADTGDLAVLWGAGLARCRPIVVITDKHLGLIVVHRQPLLDRLFAVVVALYQFFAGLVVLAGKLGRVVLDVIGAISST